MYKILLFSGGAYKFKELVEFVEDIGGIVFREERLQISRGTYFLREEVRVMIALPENELENLGAVVKELKGHLQDLELEHELTAIINFYISIYNILSIEGWSTAESIETNMKCPCCIKICSEMDFNVCAGEFRELLDGMCGMDLLEYRLLHGEREYRLKTF
ncbi:methyl-coenzyme M reductase family protein [Methanobacterium aggregans]|uniref:methyl-coenzyme M reductase family protein n=1 Tax=Methanobacterium aggregans TaxID=1615586 RepID=UPI0032116102